MSRPNDVRSRWTSSACYYSNKSTAIGAGAQTAAQMLRAGTKQRRRCSVNFAREPLEQHAQGGGRTAGQHRRCVPASRLRTARTKPGRQSECAASWLDKDGNRLRSRVLLPGECLACSASEKVLPPCAAAHTQIVPHLRLWLLSCLPTSVVALCQLASALSLRCLSLESTHRWTLDFTSLSKRQL